MLNNSVVANNSSSSLRIRNQEKNRNSSPSFTYNSFNYLTTRQSLIITKCEWKILRDSINGLKQVDQKLGDWDLVTEYDRKIEDVIIGKLKRAFPNHKYDLPRWSFEVKRDRKA